MSVNILISSKILTNNLSLKYRDFKKNSKITNSLLKYFYITLYKPFYCDLVNLIRLSYVAWSREYFAMIFMGILAMICHRLPPS